MITLSNYDKQCIVESLNNHNLISKQHIKKLIVYCDSDPIDLFVDQGEFLSKPKSAIELFLDESEINFIACSVFGVDWNSSFRLIFVEDPDVVPMILLHFGECLLESHETETHRNLLKTTLETYYNQQ